MLDSLTAHPEGVRLAAFISVFAVLALCEHQWPRRELTISKSRRWQVNLALVALDTLLARLILPLAPFALAAQLQARGLGLFNLLSFSGAGETIVSLLVLDLLIYGQHRFFHRMPLLWRLHRMHHTDLDLDVSSGTRFHPVEILLSLVIKMAAVAVLGIAPVSILLFEILLNATSMFSHANLRLPQAVDHWLRWAIVTPDMHRVHHSVLLRELDSNFGFNLPWWDRLFGSYTGQPRDGHEGMRIGLAQWRHQHELGLWPLLRIPLAPLPRRRTP